MVYVLLAHTPNKSLIAARSIIDCSPLGPMPWGYKEAIYENGKWVGIPPFEIIYTDELYPSSEDVLLKLTASWGYLEVYYSQIDPSLIIEI